MDQLVAARSALAEGEAALAESTNVRRPVENRSMRPGLELGQDLVMMVGMLMSARAELAAALTVLRTLLDAAGSVSSAKTSEWELAIGNVETKSKKVRGLYAKHRTNTTHKR